MLRTLSHENIVKYIEHEKIDDFFYIYLEYVPRGKRKYFIYNLGSITSITKKFGNLDE